jgi:hypothetical protein
MPRFRPGQSGNPTGRPRSAAGLRELLTTQYGSDAAVLVQRLEKLSTGRNPRLALEATRLLMSYCCGKPEQNLDVSGTFQHAQLVPVATDRLARMTNEELAVLRKFSDDEEPTDN